MQAFVCRATGDTPDLAIEDVAERPLGPREVRIAVKAAGLNFPDYLMVSGRYQVKPTTRGGCFATRLAVDADRVVAVPNNMDYVTAACFPVVYGTSHFALTYRGRLQSGETLVVTGAAGGVGLAAVEIGKKLGARVIAAASSTERLAVAQRYGADALIDYGREDLNARIKALTNGAGADVILDTVGGDVFDGCVRAMNWEGRLLVVGFAAGRIPQIPANLVLVKNYSVIGVVFGTQTDRDPRGTSRRLIQLLKWYEEKELRPMPVKTFSLHQAKEALHLLATHRAVGKLALTME
jgi:NADPH2:quinone reductase